MELSEKLYALRKKSGLSQEQLAEQLCVSRQAISKWETGQSVPERDKLLAIGNYFNVSLDYLMKDDEVRSKLSAIEQNDNSLRTEDRKKWLIGIIICIGGIVCLIMWGLLSVFNTSASNQIRESSMISIDGNGIFLLLCIAAIVVGASLILKDMTKK